MSNFDEAREQSLPLFETQEPADTPVEENPSAEGEQITEPAEVPMEQSAEPTAEQVAQEAVNTAEQAATVAEETGAHAQNLAQENAFLREQLQTATNTINQMSQQREQEIVEESLEEENIDFESLMFSGDGEGLRSALNKMIDREVNKRLKEMQPFIEEAQRGRDERDRREALDTLSSMEGMQGISDVADKLDVIIANNPKMFASMDTDKKYATAYAILTGMEHIKNPPQPPAPPTNEELMNMYRNNPELQSMIERERIEAVKKNQQVPVLSTSNGVGNAAPTINEKPKTMADAGSATRKMFLGM